jgi:glycosyltransferase involved in cell wall biosynthesis
MLTTAIVSTYAPHRCGIASFASDLASAIGDHQVVALHPLSGPQDYPRVVRHRIRRDARADYMATADALNRSSVDVVSIQHEYGIWGGADGAYVLDFVERLRLPVVTTLHTVLRNPTPSQRSILTELVARSATTVVMSLTAAELLTASYGVPAGKVRVVPHGVPSLPLVDPDSVKPSLGLEGRKVILSFGLLGPGKGYETVIAAMPAVASACPEALYVVLGATHPDLLLREGEAYRTRLEEAATAADVGDHVRFVNRFVTRRELGTWLMATDVFVTPYPNLDQIVSGTLSYAMSAGKAIVSTPYAYARERLAGGRGRLASREAPHEIEGALVELIADDGLRRVMGARAYAYTRGMTWAAVGREYEKILAAAALAPQMPLRQPAPLVAVGG